MVPENIRPRLFGVAYRTLGRAADAEDVVQDTWVRWLSADRSDVRDPVAFLMTITTRLALNTATSAYARREVSAGDRLPDLTAVSAEPSGEGDTLAGAVQLLMERLSPVEYAVYVLREAFEYPFREIAELLGLGEANTRQLACRARRHLAGPRQRVVDPAERDGLFRAFLAAARAGDMAGLIDLLTRPGRDRRYGCAGLVGV